MERRITLFTNLDFIQRDNVRFQCSALIFDSEVESLPGMAATARLRGFGPDGAWEVFTMWFPLGSTWKIDHADSRKTAVFIGDSGVSSPLFSGSRLTLSTGESFFLQAKDATRPLDVEDVTEIGYPGVWKLLQNKAEKYWRLPNMPRLVWGPPRRA